MKNILLSSAFLSLLISPALATEACKGHRINPHTGMCVQYKSDSDEARAHKHSMKIRKKHAHKDANFERDYAHGRMHTKMFERYDADEDGLISQNEYMAHAENHFAEIDKDDSGFISQDEATKVRHEMKSKIKERWQKKKKRERLAHEYDNLNR